jgi:hypothetical protein
MKILVTLACTLQLAGISAAEPAGEALSELRFQFGVIRSKEVDPPA